MPSDILQHISNRFDWVSPIFSAQDPLSAGSCYYFLMCIPVAWCQVACWYAMDLGLWPLSPAPQDTEGRDLLTPACPTLCLLTNWPLSQPANELAGQQHLVKSTCTAHMYLFTDCKNHNLVAAHQRCCPTQAVRQSGTQNYHCTMHQWSASSHSLTQ